MCEMSNSPATFRTAKCSSRIEVYCCGSSQPPKSTMRPPRATWRSYRGVRWGWLPVKFSGLAVIVEVDLGGVDEDEHLRVIPTPGFGHHFGDVTRSIDCPFELFGQLCLRGRAFELMAHQDVGVLVVRSRGHQQLRVADGCSLGRDPGIHLRTNLFLGEAGKVGLAAADERANSSHQPDRALLHQVGDREAMFGALAGQANDHREVAGDKPVFARRV